ncbi:MAG: helix-turn-helix transcriptional regulator [Myxococcales bacterium FL481]|nr:MAG: helix-turn-helix transcriptional regulator [Myxococcales bacterium FL481]
MAAGMDWPRLLEAVQLTSGQLHPDRRVQWARAYLEHHCCRTVSVPELARVAHMSREHFIRAFKRSYGLTPHQFQMRERISQARRLLECTDLSTTQVSLEVGFSSLGSFGSLFKRYLGHAPGRYRRHYTQGASLVGLPFVPSCFALRFGHFSRSAARPPNATLAT